MREAGLISSLSTPEVKSSSMPTPEIPKDEKNRKMIAWENAVGRRNAQIEYNTHAPHDNKGTRYTVAVDYDPRTASHRKAAGAAWMYARRHSRPCEVQPCEDEGFSVQCRAFDILLSSKIKHSMSLRRVQMKNPARLLSLFMVMACAYPAFAQRECDAPSSIANVASILPHQIVIVEHRVFKGKKSKDTGFLQSYATGYVGNWNSGNPR